jgi:hypothetical protein
MNSKINTILLLVIAVFLGMIVFRAGQETMAQTKNETDNPELVKLFNQDQDDRDPQKLSAKDFDVNALAARDAARQERVMELYKQNALKTGNDFLHAALVMHHGLKPEDFLLAHELCIVAVSKGNATARWLAAASEDRFLMSIKRPQRFGTQFKQEQDKSKRYQVGEGVTDDLRKLFGVPSLKQSKEREKQ